LEAWGGVPVKMEFGAFCLKTFTSGGNSFYDFVENKLNEFHGYQTVKANSDNNCKKNFASR